MDWTFIGSAIIAGSPAFVIIWHALRDYDYPRVEKSLFNFQTVFFTLIIGFLFGAVANVLRLSLQSGIDPVWISFLILAGMAILEESFKTVLLNIKRFQLKFDTTFYGLSLSIGIATAMAFYDNWSTLISVTLDPSILLALIFLSSGIVSLHASTGSLIGYGASKGDIFPSLLQAIMYRTVYILILLPFFLAPSMEVALVFVFASFLYGLLLYWRAFKLILPESVPEDLKKKKVREARRRRLEESER